MDHMITIFAIFVLLSSIEATAGRHRNDISKVLVPEQQDRDTMGIKFKCSDIDETKIFDTADPSFTDSYWDECRKYWLTFGLTEHPKKKAISKALVPVKIEQQERRNTKKIKCLKHVTDFNLLFDTDDPYFTNKYWDDCRKYWLTFGPTVSPAPTTSSPPSRQPVQTPSLSPSDSLSPSQLPSQIPSVSPTSGPTYIPSSMPSELPTSKPSIPPTKVPSYNPSSEPSQSPVTAPSVLPTVKPSLLPTIKPSVQPSVEPTSLPSLSTVPSLAPSLAPSEIPTVASSAYPSKVPSEALIMGSLFYEIGTFVVILEFDDNSFVRKLSRPSNRKKEKVKLVDESKLLTFLIVALSNHYSETISYFDAVDLTMQYEKTSVNKVMGATRTTVTYSFSGFVILNTSSWDGDIDASQIPNKEDLVEITLDAFSTLSNDISSFVESDEINMNDAAHTSLQEWTVRQVGESPATSGSQNNNNSTEVVGTAGSLTITVAASFIAILSTVTAFGLLYRQTRARANEAQIDTPKKNSDAADEAMIIKSSTRKFRSPFMNVTPPDGTRKYFSKLDDDSVYSTSKKYGKMINPNQSLVDSSFDESSCADSLQAPSMVGSKIAGQSDVESLAGMSALDHVRLNSVLQIEEEEAHDDRSLMSNDSNMFSRIWYGNKRNRIAKLGRESGASKSGSRDGNNIRKLSPPSKDTPTKKSPNKNSLRKSPTKTTPTKKSPTKSSPYASISKSLQAEDKKTGIDDASLLGDQSTKSEYYGQNMEGETLFYNMLGGGPNRSIESDEDEDGDDSSEDINFTEMYNGDGMGSSTSCYSENTDLDSVHSAGISRASKLSSVTGSLMVGEYDA